MVATITNKFRLSLLMTKTILFSFVLFVLISPLSNMVDAQQPTGLNVIAEIQKALANQKEMSRVVSYLKMSQNELLEELTASRTGSSEKSYTFFAPINWAYVQMLPQDIADPFFVDAQLRKNALLHHFVGRSLTKDDLFLNNELIMADQKPSTLTRIASTNGLKINKANINLKSIPIGSNLGVIYVVDKIFTTNEEIEEAIKRHPAVETPWGPINPNENNGQTDVESQTVIVDLVAEFLREEAAAGANAGQ